MNTNQQIACAIIFKGGGKIESSPVSYSSREIQISCIYRCQIGILNPICSACERSLGCICHINCTVSLSSCCRRVRILKSNGRYRLRDTGCTYLSSRVDLLRVSISIVIIYRQKICRSCSCAYLHSSALRLCTIRYKQESGQHEHDCGPQEGVSTHFSVGITFNRIGSHITMVIISHKKNYLLRLLQTAALPCPVGQGEDFAALIFA